MKVNSILFAIFLFVNIFLGCEKKPTHNVLQIINNAIEAAGGDIIANSSIHFQFRDYYYRAKRTKDIRILERCADVECQIQQDVVNENGEFVRFRESEPIPTPDSMKTRYSNSINSVHYFSVLPYGLNDGAVNKTYIDEKIINKEPYYRIKVTFNQENGGDDFQDEYLYWIHKNTYKVDYLAYNYPVSYTHLTLPTKA